MGSFNCEPIACIKILEIYLLTTSYAVLLAYNTHFIQSFVINEWTCLVAQCNNDLLLHVRERIPLLEPRPEDRETITAPWRTYPTIDDAVAAAAAASADASEAEMDICFCCCDSLTMALVCLTCCKKTILWQCLLAYLGISSQCCYCHCPVDIAKVMDYETIDRSLPQPLTPVKTPKHDLQ